MSLGRVLPQDVPSFTILKRRRGGEGGRRWGEGERRWGEGMEERILICKSPLTSGKVMSSEYLIHPTSVMHICPSKKAAALFVLTSPKGQSTKPPPHDNTRPAG